MKKVLLNGAYAAPTFRELNVRCEAGFTISTETSVGLGDLDSEAGTWD